VKQLLVDVVNSGKEPPVGCDRLIRYIITYRATGHAVHDRGPRSVIASISAIVLRCSLSSHMGDRTLPQRMRAEVIRWESVAGACLLDLVPH
jgi:hypothetical protein